MVIGVAEAYTSGASPQVFIRCVPDPPYTRLSVLNTPEGVLGVTAYVSTFCLCVLCMPNSCTVRVVQEWCSFAEPNKTCILGSMFLMTGTSAGTYPTLATPKCFCGVVACIHTLPQGEPGSEPYMCGTFTCEHWRQLVTCTVGYDWAEDGGLQWTTQPWPVVLWLHWTIVCQNHSKGHVTWRGCPWILTVRGPGSLRNTIKNQLTLSNNL